jgi:hypothetical protein
MPTSVFRCLGLLVAMSCCAGAAVAAEGLQVGAAVVDVTPPAFPVLVNGGMLSRSVSVVKSAVQARAIAIGNGEERLVIVVVDSCMMGRALLDDAKALAQSQTGLPTDRMLISATHTHTAPASMGCLGTDADPAYVPFLRARLAEVIATALQRMQPAKVGFASADAAEFTALRRWIRRPDRVELDPFGNRSVRANMHAAKNLDDVTGESGPEDPELSLIAFQSLDGQPLAALANFSMHYYGDQNISADYFGLFCEGLQQRIQPSQADNETSFVAIMSHGCSGDIWRRDYRKTPEDWNSGQATIEEFAAGLVDIASDAWEAVEYMSTDELAMTEQRMTLKYRVPDQQRLEWAKGVMAELGAEPISNREQVYAREQILLHERQQTEIVLQALRIGSIGIATTPNETYAITGLKIKAASPLPRTMVIELANGGDGYIPPPEQHLLGGYNTWAARSAGLEVTAEPQIAAACVGLLEQVAQQPRRDTRLSRGRAADDIMAMRPAAWWRLNELQGPFAHDASGNNRLAMYEAGVTYYLEGPHADAFCIAPQQNRSAMFAGGRLRTPLRSAGPTYSVSLWIWNGMPVDGRDIAGWMYSRGNDLGISGSAEHLGIGGNSGHTGRLIYLRGDRPSDAVAGKSQIPRWDWNHVILVRDRNDVRVYLNGQLEIATTAPQLPDTPNQEWFFGGRCDNQANWEGRLDEIAVFDRVLTQDEIARLALR